MLKYPSLTRIKDTLEIKLDNGEKVLLKDVESDTSIRRFRFERREKDYYIFQVCCWEWSERELVNTKTGHRITTFGEQMFSPDNRFLMSFNDEDFSRNGIEIFDLAPEARQVFLLEFRDQSMNAIKWLDSENIEFVDPNFPNGKRRRVVLKNGKWRLI